MKKIFLSCRRIFAMTCAATLLGSVASPSYATPWTVLGPRAMGMGGAYTAIAEGPVGVYWNPAGLGQPENPSGVQIPVSVHGAFSGTVLQGANDINNIFNACNQSPIGANCTQANVNNALNEMNQQGGGALIDAGLAVEFKMSRLTFFVNEIGIAGATPQVDLVNSAPLTITSNKSNILLSSIKMTEFGAGYGRTVGENTGLNVGMNLKGIIGSVGFYQFDPIHNSAGSRQVFKNLNANAATSFQPALDLGALWDVREAFPGIWWRPRLGIVARNINDPKFSQSSAALNYTAPSSIANPYRFPGQFSVQGQGRAGLALSPFHFWNIAADIDVTNNLTPVAGYKSRYFGLGTEINVFNRPSFNIPLRVGMAKNTSTNDGVAWTGGFGLNFLHVIFDLAGMVSNNRTTIQSQGSSKKIPNDVGVSAQLSVLFGGRDYKSPNGAAPAASKTN